MQRGFKSIAAAGALALTMAVGTAAQAADTIKVGILRHIKERNVTVELPEAHEFDWQGDDGKVILSVPDEIEGAMMVVPEILDDLHFEWRGPERGLRIRVPAAERVEAASNGRATT